MTANTRSDQTGPQRVLCEGLLELSTCVEDFLCASVADPGTHIDSGYTLGARDLWVTVAGEEYVVRILSDLGDHVELLNCGTSLEKSSGSSFERSHQHLNEQDKNPYLSLSWRERDVLIGVGHGKTHKEIAMNLQVSIKTVATYSRRLKRKLKLKSDCELIRYALQSGMAT